MTTAYEMMGGEAAVKALAARFYGYMDTLPEAEGIRRMHPRALDGSTEKLYLFLSGWLGGPPLYVERYGHPYLRARHMPFSIGASERDAWMACMERALEDTVGDVALREALCDAFAGVADHMRNRAEPPAA